MPQLMMVFSPMPILFSTLVAHPEQRAIIFFAQIVVLIIVGRLLGEWMQRMRQPAVLGQLLAGIVLGPSLFGAVFPTVQGMIFPPLATDRQMLSAVSELGVLMLLLLTGMEMDLALVKRVRRTAAITSIAGIIIPFGCGYLLGELLPDSILPDPGRRLFTSLFLAAALSISSVKIVAAVLREVDFLRRNLGQVIVATAILDDTIGWIILAFIGGMSAHGKLEFWPVLLSVVGTAAFLVFCFTIGPRWVARIIRWTNDHFIIEMPVITVILAMMIVSALVTDCIGVHTVLGAFMAGIMIGQSPILTKHIEEQLRGLIVALFMPVFFGVAGLSINLRVLGDPRLFALALLLIALASVGKLAGCYLGSRAARRNHQEALAVGIAMNARGSTEVILATIGLGMGVLNQQLFTLIVVMAVVTTLAMPPMLRWALARVPVSEEERVRLDLEAAEVKDLMPRFERVLVGLDSSANGRLASRLAGWLLGARQLTSTVIEIDASAHGGSRASVASERVVAAAETANRAVLAADQAQATEPVGIPRDAIAVAAEEAKAERIPVKELVSIRPAVEPDDSVPDRPAEVILAEARNGYDFLILGLAAQAEPSSGKFPPAVETIVREYAGPVAILLHGTDLDAAHDAPLQKMIVPTTGADYSRFGAEVAVAIAKGCGATITALHVSAPPTENDLLRRPNELLRPGRLLLADIVALGQREGVRVSTKSLVGSAKESAILRQTVLGGHQLIVLGTKARAGDHLHFGSSVAALLAEAPCPILIVKS